MSAWEILDRARTPDGGELILSRRNTEYVIRIGGSELMSNRGSFSEEEMARIAAARLSGRAAPRFLIGGLGMGFTTRAALDALPKDAEVTVAEIVPSVVDWNRGPLSHLCGQPLSDPRTRIQLIDVARLIATTPERFDAILLDVDNGPRGLTRKSNEVLYSPVGLASIKRALRPGGLVCVWSAGPDYDFQDRLKRAGFATDTRMVRARGPQGGARHTLFFGVLSDILKGSRK